MCCACEYLKYVVATAAIFGRVLLMKNLAPYFMTAGWIAFLAGAVLVAQPPTISEKARALHGRSLVFDGHVHAVDRVFYHGGDIGQRKPDGQFDLPRAKEGGLGALFFSIFVTEDYYPARYETKQALRMLECAVDQIARNAK